ncbi:hypothetical protein EBZ35_08875, partial [bacterium]|nr:hypothetical protein [bacterium]
TLKAAIHGLAGLSNLLKTILNNNSQCPDLGVRQNGGGRGVGWGLVLSFRYRQVYVGKTDITSSVYMPKYSL